MMNKEKTIALVSVQKTLLFCVTKTIYPRETSRRKFVPMFVFNHEWYKNIKGVRKAMLLIRGVLYYFKEAEWKAIERFP